MALAGLLPNGGFSILWLLRKVGYQNAREPTQSTNIYSFIQRLNLQNSAVTQVMAKIWHNSQPRKVGTLIWLTLNRGLPVGTWLQCMRRPLNPLNTVFSSVPLPNGLGRPSITSGKNGERPMTSLSLDHSSCWLKPSSRKKMTPSGSKGTM
jgi:hypothetical protein